MLQPFSNVTVKRAGALTSPKMVCTTSKIRPFASTNFLPSGQGAIVTADGFISASGWADGERPQGRAYVENSYIQLFLFDNSSRRVQRVVQIFYPDFNAAFIVSFVGMAELFS